MRWLFIGVVILNLLYFGWRLLDDEDASAGIDVPTEQQFPAQLALLAERSGSAPPAVPGAGARLSGCPAVGPWPTIEDARSVAGRLSAAGATAEARLVELKAVPVYWVYLPPYAERPQAMRKLRELQARGIDSFVVAQGADANAISLGSFASRDSALNVQARLRAAGYAADIREQIRDVQQQWVILKEPAAQGYMEYIPAELRAGVRQERLACN